MWLVRSRLVRTILYLIFSSSVAFWLIFYYERGEQHEIKYVAVTAPTSNLETTTLSGCKGRPLTNLTEKRILFLNGYQNYEKIVLGLSADQFNRHSTKMCKNFGYSCQLTFDRNNGKLMDYDLVVYFPDTLVAAPPEKCTNHLWAFMSGESPQSLRVSDTSGWDGLFNYSLTYLQTDEYAQLSNAYSSKFQKRDVTLERNYTHLKLKYHPDHSREANALWFVSNCLSAGKQYSTSSGRIEYGLALSKYINVHVSSESEQCTDMLGGLNGMTVDDIEQEYSSFWFYFSFENALCKDYITEKLWKILRNNFLTIPVVLGGLDMSEYEKIAPPNSFIHVKNFTSPEHLARHLQYVSRNSEAFNYYMQWRNEYEIVPDGGDFDGLPTHCYLCKLAHEKPNRVWRSFSKDFSSKSCLPLLEKPQICSYYNISCKDD